MKCPNCGSDRGEMFHSDLDWCPECHHQWCPKAEEQSLPGLVKRAIVNLKHLGRFRYEHGDDPHSLDCHLAGRVSHVFGVGMTRACEMCREAGEDPHWDESKQG